MVVGWPGRLWAIAPEEGLAKSMPVRIWKGNKATIAWYRHFSGVECYECLQRLGAELITVIKKRQQLEFSKPCAIRIDLIDGARFFIDSTMSEEWA